MHPQPYSFDEVVVRNWDRSEPIHLEIFDSKKETCPKTILVESLSSSAMEYRIDNIYYLCEHSGTEVEISSRGDVVRTITLKPDLYGNPPQYLLTTHIRKLVTTIVYHYLNHHYEPSNP